MLIQIVDKIFLVYMVMIFIRILGSWLPDLQDTRFMQFIRFYTDPYLNVFRRIIPPFGMMDFSPIIAFLCLGIIEHAVKLLIVSVIR